MRTEGQPEGAKTPKLNETRRNARRTPRFCMPLYRDIVVTLVAVLGGTTGEGFGAVMRREVSFDVRAPTAF